MAKIKRICQNPYHPFRQKWYIYHEGSEIDSAAYCSSCNHYLKTIKMFLKATMEPTPSLYGGQLMRTTPEQIHELAKEVFDSDFPW